MEIVDLADEFVHDASDETEDVRESLADEFVHDASDETEDVRESLADEFVHDASDETEDVRESLGDSEVFSRCKRAVMVASCFVGSSKSLLALWALQGTASAPAARSSPSALALVVLRSLASRAGGGAAPLPLDCRSEPSYGLPHFHTCLSLVMAEVEAAARKKKMKRRTVRPPLRNAYLSLVPA